MSTPSLETLRITVARLLPEHLAITAPNEYEPSEIRWIKWGRPVLEMEWLTVCNLAEQTLDTPQFETYLQTLWGIMDLDDKAEDTIECSKLWRASANDRLLALCRIKAPEIFNGEPE